MGEKEKRLIKKALKKYKKISPVGGRKSFHECFTRSKNRLYFWFDTEDRSTHIETEDKKPVKKK